MAFASLLPQLLQCCFPLAACAVHLYAAGGQQRSVVILTRVSRHDQAGPTDLTMERGVAIAAAAMCSALLRLRGPAPVHRVRVAAGVQSISGSSGSADWAAHVKTALHLQDGDLIVVPSPCRVLRGGTWEQLTAVLGGVALASVRLPGLPDQGMFLLHDPLSIWSLAQVRDACAEPIAATHVWGQQAATCDLINAAACAWVAFTLCGQELNCHTPNHPQGLVGRSVCGHRHSFSSPPATGSWPR